MRYATALGRNPAETYRQIDMAGRTAEANGHALVGLLYEELGHALRAAGHAAENHQYAIRADKVSRSMAILFALEAGLDFEAGGDIARTLSRLYAGGASDGGGRKPRLRSKAVHRHRRQHGRDCCGLAVGGELERIPFTQSSPRQGEVAPKATEGAEAHRKRSPTSPSVSCADISPWRGRIKTD